MEPETIAIIKFTIFWIPEVRRERELLDSSERVSKISKCHFHFRKSSQARKDL